MDSSLKDWVHETHLGTVKCKASRAREVMFWPSIGSDIEGKVANSF